MIVSRTVLRGYQLSSDGPNSSSYYIFFPLDRPRRRLPDDCSTARAPGSTCTPRSVFIMLLVHPQPRRRSVVYASQTPFPGRTFFTDEYITGSRVYTFWWVFSVIHELYSPSQRLCNGRKTLIYLLIIVLFA